MERTNTYYLRFGFGIGAISVLVLGLVFDFSPLKNLSLILATVFLAVVFWGRSDLSGGYKVFSQYWIDDRPLICAYVFFLATIVCWSIPGGFWYVPMALFGVLCVIMLVDTIRGKKKVEEPQQPDTHHGSADWATIEQVKAAGVFQAQGLYVGGEFLRSKIGHLMTIAGSRQGKGICLIIPTLLVDPIGSYVITDPKGENAFITAWAQKEAGQRVFIIDPWEEQKKLGATHGVYNSGFNPFAYLKMDPDELRDNCEQIAYFLIPDNSNAKDPYWNDRARSMIKIFLMHIVTTLPKEEHNFWTLYRLLRLSDDEWLNLLLDMKSNRAEDGLISIAAQELIGIEKAGNTMSGIKSAAHNATTMFESPQLRKSLAADDFNPHWLTEGNCSVYLVLPERFFDTHGGWLRLVIGIFLKACNAKPKRRVNFILDECAVMGKMKDIQRAYAFAAGQNIVLWTFFQNLSQVRDIYGEDAMNSFVNNAAVFQAFGIKDNFTTEYVSKMLGEGTFTKRVVTDSKSYGENGSNSTSTSMQTYARRILTPDEVEKSDAIITVAHGLRIRIARLPYFENTFPDMEPSAYIKWNEDQIAKGEQPTWHYLFSKRADRRPRTDTY